MITLHTPEDHLQYQLLKDNSATGDAGHVRYAAAMYFFNRGMINESALEIYRTIVKNPAANPLAALVAAQCQEQIELSKGGSPT